MSRKIKGLSAIAVAAALSLAGSGVASAAVTFDPATGTGFVGKGDVQTAFGLNNKQMQEHHTHVQFVYEVSATYSQECEKFIETKKETKVIQNTFKKSVDVDATVASDSRKTGQWTGWFLNGYQDDVNIAVPTDLCNPGNESNQSGWVPATYEDNSTSQVTLLEGSESGRLFAVEPDLGKKVQIS